MYTPSSADVRPIFTTQLRQRSDVCGSPERMKYIPREFSVTLLSITLLADVLRDAQARYSCASVRRIASGCMHMSASSLQSLMTVASRCRLSDSSDSSPGSTSMKVSTARNAASHSPLDAYARHDARRAFTSLWSCSLSASSRATPNDIS